MIKSYRIFVGRNNIKKYFLFVLAVFGVLLATGIVYKTVPVGAVKGLIEVFVPLICTIVLPVCSLVTTGNIYNSNIRGELYGYNYFHSLKDSAKHFKNALICVNVMSLIIILPYVAFITAFFPVKNTIILISFMMLALGMMNLFGYVQSLFARIFPLAFLGGCIGGFFSLAEELEDHEVYYFLTILGIVSAALYLIGILYSAIRAEAAWNREGKDGKASESGKAAPQKSEVCSDKIQAKRFSKGTKQSGFSFIKETFLRTPKWATVFVLLFSLVSAVLPYAAHEHIGSEDYLFPKIFVFFPSMFLTEMTIIFLIRDFAGNKFVRSMPIAKQVYTRSLPSLIVVLTLGLSTVLMGCYFVFLKCIGAEVGQFSDTLLLGTVVCGSLLFFAPVFTQSPAGGVIMIYLASLPLVAAIFLMDGLQKSFGFGVPLHISIIIFLLAAVLGTMWAFFYSSQRYKKKDGKFFSTQYAVK